jgi:hypothetical protein
LLNSEHYRENTKQSQSILRFQRVARKYSVLSEIIDIFTQACKVCIHDEDATKAAFEHTFETPKEFRSRSGKPCALPAIGRYETVCQTTPTSQPGSSLLNLAFSILEQLAGAIDRRQTRNCHSVASKGFQAVLEVQVPT